MQNNLCGIHHVALTVKDFDQSVAFYEALGLTRTVSWDMGKKAVMLSCGNGAFLELFAGQAQTYEDKGWQHVALSVKDCQQIFDLAVAQGAPIKMPPTTIDIPSSPEIWKITVAFVYGPDGEIVEFFERKAD